MLSVLLASALVASVNAIDTISVKGSKFFTEDGNQFFVKGMQMNTKKTQAKAVLTDGRHRLPTRSRRPAH
jgi:hypothetical protein